MSELGKLDAQIGVRRFRTADAAGVRGLDGVVIVGAVKKNDPHAVSALDSRASLSRDDPFVGTLTGRSKRL